VLTTADAIDFIELVYLHVELQNMQPGTSSLVCSQIAWQMTHVSGLLSIVMSDGDYRCHRTRNIGSYLKWNEGGAVGV
jgi:hypothetical protein